jgi:hypothetical protein
MIIKRLEIKKEFFSTSSIFISAVSLSILLKINYVIAKYYLMADVKTRSLFGIVELLNFSYKYYLLILSLISVVLAYIASRRQESSRFVIPAYLLTCISTILVFFKIWKIFVNIV